jgi:hypothetical protein
MHRDSREAQTEPTYVMQKKTDFLPADLEVRVRFQESPDPPSTSGSGAGPTQPRQHNRGATRKKNQRLQKTAYTVAGIRHADHAAPSTRKSWHPPRRQAAAAQ